MRASCREPERYLAWLGQIARHEALRLDGRQRLSEPLEEGTPAADEAVTDRLTTRLAVQTTLQELGPEDKALLQLRYGEDLTYAELSRRLGMPVGTAKVRLHRLHARLRPRFLDAECLPKTKTRD